MTNAARARAGALCLATALFLTPNPAGAGPDPRICPEDMPPAADLDPVVLVGGASGGRYFEDTADQLIACGWPKDRVYRYYRQATGCIAEETEHVRDFIDGVLAETGAAKVDVMGYSLGGLMVRHWIAFFGGADLTDEVVLWGAPNHGSPYTQPDDPYCWMRELRAPSAYAACLNGESGDTKCGNPFRTPAPWASVFSEPGGIAYYNLYSPQDLFLPAESTLLEGAMNISLPWTVHTDFHRKPEVRRLTMLGFLRREAAVSPGYLGCGTTQDPRGALLLPTALLYLFALRLACGRRA